MSKSEVEYEPGLWGGSYLGVEEFARVLNVSPSTVRRSIRLGRLRSVRLSARGQSRIPRSEISRLMLADDRQRELEGDDE